MFIAPFQGEKYAGNCVFDEIYYQRAHAKFIECIAYLYYLEDYLFNKRPITGEIINMDLDLIDLRILRHLELNAKATNQEIAEAVNLSASACFRRVKLMEDSGVIAQYRCDISAKEVGIEFESMVHVSMRHDVERWHEKFIHALSGWPEVVEARIVTGTTNYILTVRARNLEHYSDFIQNQLHKVQGVMSTNSCIVLNVLKRNGSLLDMIKVR